MPAVQAWSLKLTVLNAFRTLCNATNVAANAVAPSDWWARSYDEIMFFERQLTAEECPASGGLWCGVHALNNILGEHKFSGEAMAQVPDPYGGTKPYDFSRGILQEAILRTPRLSSFSPGWTPKLETGAHIPEDMQLALEYYEKVFEAAHKLSSFLGVCLWTPAGGGHWVGFQWVEKPEPGSGVYIKKDSLRDRGPHPFVTPEQMLVACKNCVFGRHPNKSVILIFGECDRRGKVPTLFAREVRQIRKDCRKKEYEKDVAAAAFEAAGGAAAIEAWRFEEEGEKGGGANGDGVEERDDDADSDVAMSSSSSAINKKRKRDMDREESSSDEEEEVEVEKEEETAANLAQLVCRLEDARLTAAATEDTTEVGGGGGAGAGAGDAEYKLPDHLMWIRNGKDSSGRQRWKIVSVAHFLDLLRRFKSSTAGDHIKGNRLERVRKIAASCKQGVSGATGTLREMESLLDNGNVRTGLCIAMVFQLDNNKYDWCLGQISKIMMFTTKWTELKFPVGLTAEHKLPADIFFVCDWFERVGTNRYVLKSVDAHRWTGEAFLRVVDMKIVKEEEGSDGGEGSSSGSAPAAKTWQLVNRVETERELNTMVGRVDPRKQQAVTKRKKTMRKKTKREQNRIEEEERDRRRACGPKEGRYRRLAGLK